MPDVTVADSGIHGLGVFAARDLAEGEIILAVDDSRIVDDQHPLRPGLGEHHYHCDYLAGGQVVLMGWPERYVNSSCDPNACYRWGGGVRRLVARRPIGAGEEVTTDYIIDCHGGEVWRCWCGSGRCRGTIVSSFFELPLGLQLEYLPLLSEWFIAEHPGEVAALRRAAGGTAPLPAPSGAVNL